MLHCTRQPPTANNYLALNVNSAENGSTGAGCSPSGLSLGWGIVVGQIASGLVGHTEICEWEKLGILV